MIRRWAIRIFCIIGLLLVVWWIIKPRLGSGPGYGGLIRQGKALVHAIDTYKTDDHTYPPSLQELVPRYMPSIPVPRLYYRDAWFRHWADGGKWQYELTPDKTAYRLWSESFPFGYESETGEWDFDFTKHRRADESRVTTSVGSLM